MKIGFLGFGKMAKAIAYGLLQSNSSYQLYCYDIHPNTFSDFEQKNLIKIIPNLQAIEEECDILIFSVKPKDLKDVVTSCKGYDTKHYISIAAGISTKKIHEWNSHIKNLSRVMPNLGAFAKHSVSAIFSSNQETLNLTKSIFDNLGITILIDNEELMHAITGLSGSGPAYVFLFLQAMIEAGIREGLSYELSYQASLHTILGSVKALWENNQKNQTLTHPADWIKNVTSPGGTTIEGLVELEKNHFKYAIYNAIHQSTNKSKELGK